VEFPNSFINLHTVARLTECLRATSVSDIPVRRSSTTCSRLMSSRARPICRPSSLARRMPARTRSTMSKNVKSVSHNGQQFADLVVGAVRQFLVEEGFVPESGGPFGKVGRAFNSDLST
jgi:hypothetical protein